MTTNHQPPPTQGVEAVYPHVMKRIQQRVEAGIQSYGRPLETHNGRAALEDLRDEQIDAVFYTTQCIIERDDEITFLRQWLRDTLGIDDEFINLVFANWLRQKKSYEQNHRDTN